MNDAPGIAKVFIDLIVRHPDFPTRSTETQSPPLSLGPPDTTFELDCRYHLRVNYENI